MAPAAVSAAETSDTTVSVAPLGLAAGEAAELAPPGAGLAPPGAGAVVHAPVVSQLVPHVEDVQQKPPRQLRLPVYRSRSVLWDGISGGN